MKSCSSLTWTNAHPPRRRAIITNPESPNSRQVFTTYKTSDRYIYIYIYCAHKIKKNPLCRSVIAVGFLAFHLRFPSDNYSYRAAGNQQKRKGKQRLCYYNQIPRILSKTPVSAPRAGKCTENFIDFRKIPI